MTEKTEKKTRGISKDRLTIERVDEDLVRAIRKEAIIDRGIPVREYLIRILKDRKKITDTWK